MDTVPSSDEPIVLSVFWCGTGSDRKGTETQIQLFHAWCQAIDLSDIVGDLNEDYITSNDEYGLHYKLIFDGCAVAYGTSGMLWGTGLDAQADLLRSRMTALRDILGTERRIILNLFGLSRGGVACFIAARKLAKWDPAQLDVNILAFDPVPGNFVATAKLDFFGFSNAWANMDLTKSPVVKTALLLYPYEALPTLAVHAPMIPKFSPTTSVCYEVILGCHQGAMFNTGYVSSLDIKLSAVLIRNFLTAHGTHLDVEQITSFYSTTEKSLLAGLATENDSKISATRSTHSKGGIEIKRRPDREYLNKTHYLLQQMSENGVLKQHWPKMPYIFAQPISTNPAPSFSLYMTSDLSSP